MEFGTAAVSRVIRIWIGNRLIKSLPLQIMSIEQLLFRYIVTVKEGIATCSGE
jgi:hypothetical protein